MAADFFFLLLFVLSLLFFILLGRILSRCSVYGLARGSLVRVRCVSASHTQAVAVASSHRHRQKNCVVNLKIQSKSISQCE